MVREGVGQGGEMTQTLYAHMNKIKINKKQINKNKIRGKRKKKKKTRVQTQGRSQ
jgi:hypothetical protein